MTRQRSVMINNTTASPRHLMVLILLLATGPFVAAESYIILETVANWLQNLHDIAERKSLSWYRYFGETLNRHRHHGRMDCDYDDPDKIQFCPPEPRPPFHVKGRQKNISPWRSSSTNDKDKISSSSLPIKCLDSPNDPDCRRLLFGPPTFVYSMPTGTRAPLATIEPTRDDCYGNMLDGKKDHYLLYDKK